MSSKQPRPIEIFQAGTHQTGDGRLLTFSAADLQAAADAYDPAVFEAPLVIGHPTTNDPAYGWVQSLDCEGGALKAQPRQVHPAFAEAVLEERYKKVSAAFYVPSAPANPKPGVYYLRHVGFLGAQAPAVKGLPCVKFSEADEGVVEFSGAYSERTVARLFRGLREWFIGKHGLEAADEALPGWSVQGLEEEAIKTAESETAQPSFSEPPVAPGDPEMDETKEKELAAREQANREKEEALAKQAAEFAEREKGLTDAEAKARHTELAEFVEGLVKDGARVLPADKAAMVELMAGIPDDSVIEFVEADGDKPVKPPALDWLKSWLGRLPEQVDFSERAPSSQTAEPGDPAAIAAAAQKYQAEQANAGIDVRTSDAVRHVTGR